jgi:hypothetical protein
MDTLAGVAVALIQRRRLTRAFRGCGAAQLQFNSGYDLY